MIAEENKAKVVAYIEKKRRKEEIRASREHKGYIFGIIPLLFKKNHVWRTVHEEWYSHDKRIILKKCAVCGTEKIKERGKYDRD